MRRSRVLAVAFAALFVSVLAFGGSALQFSLTVGEALAQSSVRPPDNAVNVAPTPQVVLPGGSVRPPADAMVPVPTEPGMPREGVITPDELSDGDQGPLGTRGFNSDADLWSYLRGGGPALVSIPDANAAVLVQDDGMRWLQWRAKEGPLQVWGGIAMAAMLGILLLYYLLRGRIRIEHGRSGVTIERFKGYERFAHWVLAGSFILLALSGLNLLYGRDYLLPLVGKEVFAAVTLAGKWVHNNVAWAFMAALVMVFVIWVVHNLPSRHDLVWIAKGGGMFTRGVHPPAKKFNAGQKLIFWAVILSGLSISLSGLSLLLPFQAPLFAKTFVVLNDTGVSGLVMGGPLPVELSAIQEMQYAQIWHTIVALGMIVIIMAHIYLGSIGMEGAFDAMGSGHVDRNWALEHHSLWVAEQEGRSREAPHAAATPAE